MAKKSKLTCGQMESLISDSVTKFEKEVMGRGPSEIKTTILNDMVIVRLKGILTKSELELVHSEKKSANVELIKKYRNSLLENNRNMLEVIIKSVTKKKVKSLYTDISTVHGERLLVFILDSNIEF